MKVAVLTLAAALGASGAYAQTAAANAAAPAATVSLNASSMDVHDAVRSLATASGQKILIGAGVTGKVTTQLTNVPLETALSTITGVTGVHWSKITVAPGKDDISAAQASALVAAAQTLAKSAVSVETAGSAVSVGRPHATAPAGSVTIYLVDSGLTTADVQAARDQRTADAEAARLQAITAQLSPEDQKDPVVAKAYAAMQNLTSDQIAAVGYEFMTHLTPDQRQQFQDSMRARFQQGGAQGMGPG